MGIEYGVNEGNLVWVRNPFTGTVTYFTEVHRKQSGFRRIATADADASQPSATTAEWMLEEARRCPFCPGNERACADEVLRVRRSEVWRDGVADSWLIRAVRNIVPRVPEVCTGGKNESYVVIEDPRHFADPGDEPILFHSSLLEERQFAALLDAELDVARRAYANPAVRSVLIRKNQGRQSGASQPHVHSQVIGADRDFPAVAAEQVATAANPGLWEDIVEFVRRHGYMIREGDGCFAYFCPFGVFPRSYDVVSLRDRARMVDVPDANWREFVSMLYGILQLLGDIPLDYEIHDGPGIPLHAHVNTRHFPFSSVGGTLNLPTTLAEDPRLAQVLR